MSQCILERLETKMDRLIALYGNGTTAELGEAVDEIGVVTVHTPTTSPELTPTNSTDDPYAGVDKDGVVWDARIHSKAKEPKSVTTGKWKRKKGIQDELYNTVTVELKAGAPALTGPFFWVDTSTNVSNTCETRAEMDELLTIPTTKELTEAEFDELLQQGDKPAPSAPSAPVAPKAPSAPKATAPIAPPAPVENSVKTEVLGLIKELQVTFGVEPNDITGLMKETTGFDTIGKITDDKMTTFRDSLITWVDTVETAQTAVDGMRAIAEPHGLIGALNDGLETILEPHDADSVGIVHYSAIGGVRDQMVAYLKTWQEM